MDERWNNLTCEEVERSIAWFLDDELDPGQALEIEAHLDQCSRCRKLLEAEGRLRVVLRQAARNMAAPARLRRRLDEAIELEHNRRVRPGRRWPAVAAAAVLLVAVWQGAGREDAEELREAAARHARNLPMDVVAADVNKVQQYFAENLPFAVRLPRLARPAAFNASLGGRVTQINRRDAAYVRYDLPRGRVSVFVYESPMRRLPAEQPLYKVHGEQVELRRVRGFTTMRWHRDGLVYSVVTDLPERDLFSLVSDQK